MTDIKNLITTIVTGIVNNPDAVSVTDRESADFKGLTIFEIDVAPEDKGILIGRKGKTINSIRDIVRISAIRNDVRVRVTVRDDERDENVSTSQSDEVESGQPEQIDVESLETPSSDDETTEPEVASEEVEDILSDEI